VLQEISQEDMTDQIKMYVQITFYVILLFLDNLWAETYKIYWWQCSHAVADVHFQKCALTESLTAALPLKQRDLFHCKSAA